MNRLLSSQTCPCRECSAAPVRLRLPEKLLWLIADKTHRLLWLRQPLLILTSNSQTWQTKCANATIRPLATVLCLECITRATSDPQMTDLICPSYVDIDGAPHRPWYHIIPFATTSPRPDEHQWRLTRFTRDQGQDLPYPGSGSPGDSSPQGD